MSQQSLGDQRTFAGDPLILFVIHEGAQAPRFAGVALYRGARRLEGLDGTLSLRLSQRLFNESHQRRQRANSDEDTVLKRCVNASIAAHPRKSPKTPRQWHRPLSDFRRTALM